MTLPRLIWNMLAGIVRHRWTPPAQGLLISRPAIWKTRIGVIDVDVNAHLNNSSYLTQMDLSIWYAVGHTGIWKHVLKNRWHFLVGAQAIRYRHAVPPYRAIEVHSQVIYWDDSWMYIRSRFVDPATSLLYAEGLRRFALRKGKDTVNPSKLITRVTSEATTPPAAMPPCVRDFLAWDASTATSMKDYETVETPKSATADKMDPRASFFTSTTDAMNLPWKPQ